MEKEVKYLEQTAMNIPSFSDVVGERFGIGTSVETKNLVGKEFVVNNYKIMPPTTSKFQKEWVICNITLNGEQVHFNTGSGVMVDQLKKIGDKIPFRATIKQIKGKTGQTYLSFG